MRMASFSTLTPDLVIDDITWSPQEPSENDEVIFTITIKNRGSGRAGTSSIAFYIDDLLIGEQEVQEISAGSTVTEAFTWSAQLGTHEIRIMADETNHMAEIDETNNEEKISFSTAIPDLVVEDITWSPQEPSENDEVTFTITIKNQGSGRAGTSSVAFYIDDLLIGEQEVQEIGAGSTVTEAFTWSAQPGIHFIKLVADCGQTLTESDETNNVKLRVTSLTAAGGNAATSEGNLLSPPDEREGLGNFLYLIIIVSCAFIGWIIYGLIKFRSQ
jgi:subtilase family serine protease